MALANELSAFVQSLKLYSLDDETVSEARTLLLDALACTIAGADAAVASIAMAGVSPWRDGSGATIVVHGGRTDPAGAAFVNGAMLRSLDLMDTYVALDVCHPSEIIPVALACAESGGASGAEFLATMVAGLSVHQSLAQTIPLHRHGLHHAGHAAWVVPLAGGPHRKHDRMRRHGGAPRGAVRDVDRSARHRSFDAGRSIDHFAEDVSRPVCAATAHCRRRLGPRGRWPRRSRADRESDRAGIAQDR